MEMQELAHRLVALCNDQQFEAARHELHADDVGTIGASGTEQLPARIEGIDAVRRKGDCWSENHDVHAMRAEGPFIGHRSHRPDPFAVRFSI